MMLEKLSAYVKKHGPLRPWQTEWIDVMNDRKDTRESNTSACTGAGKSTVQLIAPWITDGKRVAYIFPSLELLKQFHREYLVPNYVKNVVYNATEETLKNVPRVDPSDLIRKNEFVFLTTYNSAPLLFVELSVSNQLDVLVVDEAHHTIAEGYQTESYEFVKKVYHFSATLPEDMEVHFKLSLLEGIRKKYVRDFHIEIMVGLEEERSMNVITYLKEVMRKTGNKKAMVFTSYTAERKDSELNSVVDFVNAYKDEEDVWIRGITAETPNRTLLIKEFEKSNDDKLHVLVSCRTIGEGVDTKETNIVCFWNATESKVAIIQRLGRGLRRYSGDREQPETTVFIPVFLNREVYESAKGDAEKIRELFAEVIQAGKNGDFQSIFNILGALKDEEASRNDELFDEIRAYPGEKRGSKKDRKSEEEGEEGESEEGRSEGDEGSEEEGEEGESEEESEEGRSEGDEGSEEGRSEGDEGSEEGRSEGDEGSEEGRSEGDEGSEEDSEEGNEEGYKRKEKKVRIGFSDAFKIMIDVHPDEIETLGENLTVKIQQKIEYTRLSLEQRVLEKWRKNCEWAIAYCDKSGIERKNYFPKKDNEYQETKINQDLHEYRKTLRKGKFYESVNVLINSHGFELWLKIQSHEEKALEKWKKYCEWSLLYCDKNGIEHKHYTPSQTSSIAEIKKIERALSHYRNAINKKDTSKVYESINMLIRSYGFIKWIDNLQSYEERALEKWKEHCEWAVVYCEKNGFERQHYFPDGKDTVEKKLQGQLEHYRATLNGKGGGGKIYDSVNNLILSYGFEKWLKLQTNEEKSLKKWKESCVWAVAYCEENGIERKNYLPSAYSQINEVKKLGVQVSNYRSALSGTTQGKIYQSVNDLILSYGFEKWLKLQTNEDIALEKWKTHCEWAVAYCEENEIERRDFFPSKEKKEQENVGKQVSSYRDALSGTTQGKTYQCVNDLILSYGFEKWLKLQTNEEKSLEKWKEYCEWAVAYCEKNGIEKKKYKPNEKSNQADVKKVGKQISHYRTALSGNGRGKTYQSVNSLVRSYAFTRWFDDLLQLHSNDTESVSSKTSSSSKKTSSTFNPTTISNEELDSLGITALKEVGKYYSVSGYSKYTSSNKQELVQKIIEKRALAGDTQSVQTTTTTTPKKPSKKSLVEEATNLGIDVKTKDMIPVLQEKIAKRKKDMETAHPTIVNAPPKENTNKVQKTKSQLEIFHNKYKKMTSTNLHAHFTKNPAEWHAYHAVSHENEASYGDKVPIQSVIEYLSAQKNKKVKTVVDLGAGTGRLEKAFEDGKKFKVIGFDHVSVHPNILEKDFADTGLEDECAHYVVMCLAMWGTMEDKVNYLEEVHRILDDQGKLIIVESFKKWVEEDAETRVQKNRLKELLEQSRFLVEEVAEGKFLRMVARKM
jgi:superfamily II DNA or RNA helicase